MLVQAKITGDGHPRTLKAMRRMSSKKHHTRLDHAVKKVGRRIRPHIVAALSEQTGLTTSDVVAMGGVVGGGGGKFRYIITSQGFWISLKHFAPKQVAGGVIANPWGRSTLFDGAFMGPRPGEVSPRLGGHVFTRTTWRRLPIEKLWGPNVAREMTRGRTVSVFETRVGEALPAEVVKAFKSSYSIF